MTMRSTLLGLALALALPDHLAAQAPRTDRLRILRLDPSGPADPLDSLVIAFDHPVAPRLDRSVDPSKVVKIDPAVSSKPYWRDPSTLVVRFAEPLPFGARYMVSVTPTLRDATGVPLAEGQQREVHVRPPRLLLVFPSGSRARADTWQRPYAVYEAPVPLGAVTGRLVTMLDENGCRPGLTIPLHADSIRPILPSDPQEVREARSESRDRRLDSLRRVVRFTSATPIAEGCLVKAWVSGTPGGAENEAGPFVIPLRFAVKGVACSNTPCEQGNVVVTFTRPVSGAQVEGHVRVNGAHAVIQPLYGPNGPYSYMWRLQQIVMRGKDVTVSVDSSITDAFGEVLGAEVRRTVKTDSPLPRVDFVTGPVIVPRDADMAFAVQHVNTDSIVIAIGRVADSLRPALLRSRWFGYRDGTPRMEPDSIVRVVATPAPADTGAIFIVPPSWIPRAWQDEPMLLFRAQPRHPVHQFGVNHWFPHAVIQRTDIAAHMLFGDGTLDVWVTALKDVAPIAGARLRLLAPGNRVLAAGTTDERGRGRLRFTTRTNGDWQSDALLEVRARNERLLLLLPSEGRRSQASEETDEASSGYYRRAGGALPDGRTLHGVAFTDRGIYRPGERIQLKGMVRTSRPDAGFATPAGDSVRWTLSIVGVDYKLERIERSSARLSAFGTTDVGFDVPRTAALGTYVATLSYLHGKTWRITAETSVGVAEYRPVEFAVALDADTSRVLFAGDSARVRVNARYLFGMPMDGGALTWSARIDDRDFWSVVARLPALDGFNVGRSWRRTGVGRNWVQPVSDSTTLGADGTATIVAPVGEIATASTLVVSAVVSDANRRTVTAERQLTVHAADAYVGIRAAPWRWMRNVGDSVGLELLVVRANGALRPGTPITLRAVHTGFMGIGQPADTVWRTETKSADSIVHVAFVPKAPGWYELLASAVDDRARAAVSGMHIWVAGSAVAARPGNDLTVTMDRESYTPGDTAIVVIDAPSERSAWVTLSTSMPLFERQVALRRGPNLVQIPIPLSAMPTARLGVIALRPVAPRDSGAMHYTKSEQWVTVATSPRALDVRVSPEHTRYQPGDTVTLRVHVNDASHHGRRAEATVWAVDQGVAALTGLEKPDLLEPLLSGVDAVSATSTLVAPVLGLNFANESLREAMVRIRGISSHVALEEVVVTGMGVERRLAQGAPLRSMFATTPFWAANVVADSAGDATTRFVLPHNVTTFRLFAAAITAGTEVGSGDSSIVVTRPLLVRAALPRVVRQGDTLLAGGVVTQDTTASTPVRVAIETRGILVDGPSTKADTLDGRRARELRFPMRVTAGDSVTVTLRAEGGDRGDAVRTTLPVSPPGHARAHVVMGTLEGRADVALPAVDGIDSARSTVTLQLGPSPLGIVRQLDGALRIYPYYCTEQITSAARALLARRSLERVMDAESELSRSDRAQLERGVAVLVSRQREDGGIGYWSAADWSTPWLTAYALSMMFDARDAGIQVPASTVSRALAYLTGGKADRSDGRRRIFTDSSAHDLVAAVRLLRRVGAPDRELEDSLRARASKLDYADRLEYAMMRAEDGDSATARGIVRDAWQAARREGRLVRVDSTSRGGWWLFPSAVRPATRLFTATATLDPRHPLLGALFESIIQTGRSASHWQWNTIEQAEVADAIAASRVVFGFGGARSVTVRAATGAELATSRFVAGRTDSASFALAALGPARSDTSSRLTLEADARAPIYYAATLFETPRARPVRADDEGIAVERWYESYATGKPIVSVREGELVRVRLRVTLPRDREFVAITDPLPAGLEAVDLSLRTSSTLAPFAGAPRRTNRDDDAPPAGRWMYGSWDSGWWTPWDHREIRDDRVHWFARQLWKGAFDISYVARATTAGVFVRPPAYAEEMYNPGVRGRSDGGWFTVEAKP
jgi:uncharacterized protein YfaS (alpha-2-macroglobulin family)